MFWYSWSAIFWLKIKLSFMETYWTSLTCNRKCKTILYGYFFFQIFSLFSSHFVDAKDFPNSRTSLIIAQLGSMSINTDQHQAKMCYWSQCFIMTSVSSDQLLTNACILFSIDQHWVMSIDWGSLVVLTIDLEISTFVLFF